MVQVDVFWSYGIGAGLGLASAARRGVSSTERPLEALASREAFHTLLFLALVFAPSGFVLLWSFPSWETMHVGTHALPGWLVALFAVTNITQGLLGFLVARWLAVRGHTVAALTNWLFGYVGMFFILIHGWDGTGYQRFFSARPEALTGWTWATARDWLTSDVALTLMVMGVVLIPWLVGLSVRWLAASAGAPSALRLIGLVLGLLLIGAPGFALVASGLIRVLGSPVGAPIATLLAFVVVKLGPLDAVVRWLGFPSTEAKRLVEAPV